MRGRHGFVVLPLILGLALPLGCMRCCWKCCVSPMHAPTSANAPSGVATGQMNSEQTAQLSMLAGDRLEKQGYIDEAIQQYENARTHNPQLRSVSRRLAVLYDLQGQPQKAEAEYTRALQEHSGDAELLNDCGYFHYRHDHPQVAENWLRNAVTINPNLKCAWINLGVVLARQGRQEESYQAFAHVLRPAEAYSNLGVLLAKQGRNSEAREALKHATSLDPALEQPRAFLKALPSSPDLLPPGITQNTPQAPNAAPLLPTPARMPESLTAVSSAALSPSRVASSPVKATELNQVPAAGEPRIIRGPITPVPLARSIETLAPQSAANGTIGTRTPPPSPPPPPPPAPLTPLSSVPVRDSSLLRTSAVTGASQWPSNPKQATPVSGTPPSLPTTSSSTPLTPAATRPRTGAIAQPVSVPPQATLTDCQSDSETAKKPIP